MTDFSALCLEHSTLDPLDRERLAGLGDFLQLLSDLGDSHLSVYLPGDEKGSLLLAAETSPQLEEPLHMRRRMGERVSVEKEPIVAKTFHTGRLMKGVEGSMDLGVPLKETFVPIRSVAGSGTAAVIRIGQNLLRSCPHKVRFWRLAPLAFSVAPLFDGMLTRRTLYPFFSCCSGIVAVNKKGFIGYADPAAQNHLQRLGLIRSGVPTKSERWVELESLHKPVYLKSRRIGDYLDEDIQVGTLFYNRKTILLGEDSPSPYFKVVAMHNISDRFADQMDSVVKAAVLQELHHRVKNNLQTVASLIRMQIRRSDNEEVKQVLHRTINRILSISTVHEALSKRRVQEAPLDDIAKNILKFTRQNAEDLGVALETSLTGRDISLPTEIAAPLAVVVNELTQNALEHGFAGRSQGKLSIEFGSTPKSNEIRMAVQDDGVGMPEGFDVEKRGGIGLSLVYSIIQNDLGGSLTVTTPEGGGTRFEAVVAYRKDDEKKE